VSFAVEAHDGIGLISHGTHERAVINRARFDAKARAKRGPSR
jgi:fluoroacetyl-CoA thioesterase